MAKGTVGRLPSFKMRQNVFDWMCYPKY